MRLSEDLIATRVRAALGEKYDAAAEYRVVRPAMAALPKYRDYETVGEFVEDSRAEGRLVVLRRKAAAKPPPSVVQSAAEKVRTALSTRKPSTPKW